MSVLIESDEFSCTFLYAFRPHISPYLHWYSVRKNQQKQGHINWYILLYCTMDHIYTNEHMFHKNSIQFAIYFVSIMKDQHEKHNSFNKNWNNFFCNCFWHITMYMFVAIGTLNTHNYQILTIFISKFNYEHRKYLQRWFQDRMIGIICDSVGCITLNILELNHRTSWKTFLGQWYLLKVWLVCLFWIFGISLAYRFLMCCSGKIYFPFHEKGSMLNLFKTFFKRYLKRGWSFQNIMVIIKDWITFFKKINRYINLV